MKEITRQSDEEASQNKTPDTLLIYNLIRGLCALSIAAGRDALRNLTRKEPLRNSRLSRTMRLD